MDMILETMLRIRKYCKNIFINFRAENAPANLDWTKPAFNYFSNRLTGEGYQEKTHNKKPVVGE